MYLVCHWCLVFLICITLIIVDVDNFSIFSGHLDFSFHVSCVIFFAHFSFERYIDRWIDIDR